MNLKRAILSAIIIVLAFWIYTRGVGVNPPGFYVDESALSYNAYLVSTTGAGEFGKPGTVYFQIYTGGFSQYSNPTHIYLLAIAFFIFGPSIAVAKLTAAFCVFAACLLLGFLAFRMSQNVSIGVIVAILALLTPWLFEISRLVLETFFYPLATVFFICAVWQASRKESWSWLNAALIAGSLTLLVYSYTIGRMLGPLFALCLICFAVNRKMIYSVGKTWILFAIALIPLIVFNIQNPELRTRFYVLSYIKPKSTLGEIIPTFIGRFLEDINPLTMLLTGDINHRHHIPFALGSFYIAVFVLAIVGLIVVLTKRRGEAFWRFAVCGLLVSAMPGAFTNDAFHTLRMLAYPIFLLIMTIPALELLLEKGEAIAKGWQQQLKYGVLALVLLGTFSEASYFFYKYYSLGETRGAYFDAGYKPLYDAAIGQKERPIYLEDGYWGPEYIHAYWFAATEGIDKSNFIHLKYGTKAPPNSIVLSSERDCVYCQIIQREEPFMLYRTLP